MYTFQSLVQAISLLGNDVFIVPWSIEQHKRQI